MAEDLDTLFRLYRRELWGMAYRRVGDREAAADLVQDTFLRYAAARPVGLDNPRSFLWRVLGNLVLDLQRSLRRRGRHDDVDAMTDDLVDPRPGPEQVLASRQQLRLLTRALAELPEDCRAALLLNRLEGLSHAEVGQRLGISASMVSKHIMRGLRHCARRLGLAR